jgi:NADH-quinone oxidoreductase subunit C
MLPERLKAIPALSALEEQFPGAVESASDALGEPTLWIAKDQILPVCRFLKEQGFIRLSGITAVDRHPAAPRFEVVYLLHSLEANIRVRLKCRVGEPFELDSVTGVWRSANWYEREVFDLFGVVFRNHPSLRRILMPENWEGHPLRKDYPVHGFKYSYKDE